MKEILAGRALPTDAQMDELTYGQNIKDILFYLLGEPERIGKKNTPRSYGTTTDELRESVKRLVKEKSKA
jgi:hypothetical protein